MCSRGAGVVYENLSPSLPAALSILTPVLGVWRGTGKGEYPTISPFAFNEETRLSHVGKPFLVYNQRTWSVDDTKTPMHTESGYIRVRPHSDDSSFEGLDENKGAVQAVLELILADPTGSAQVYQGTVQVYQESPDASSSSSEEDPGKVATVTEINFRSTSIVCTPTSKPVQAVTRTWIFKHFKNDSKKEWSYTMSMAAVGQPLSHHLSASLLHEPATNFELRDVPVSELATRLENKEHLDFVDLREKEEFQNGHLEGSINIPMGKFISTARRAGSDAYNVLHPQEGVAAPALILYCGSGVRSRMVLEYVSKIGDPPVSRRVSHLDGGYGTWKQKMGI